MKLQLLTLFFLVSNVVAFSQPEYEWSMRFGEAWSETIQTVHVDSEGNIFIYGDLTGNIGTYTLSGSGKHLIKLDADMNVIWSKQVPGSVNQDSKAMAVDDDGNVFIIGYFFTTINFYGTQLTGSNSGGSAYVCKFGESGNFLWARVIKPAVNGSAQGRSVDCDTMGNVIVGGDFRGATLLFDGISVSNLANPIESSDFIAKYNASGDVVWARTVGSIKSSLCDFHLVIDDNNDTYVTTGIENDTLIFANDTLVNPYSGTSNMMLLAKFNDQGEELWAKVGKAMAGNSSMYGMAVTADNEKNVYITGTYYGQVDIVSQPSLGLNQDVFVAKYDSHGNLKWSRAVGTTSTEECRTIAVDNYHNVFISGYLDAPFLNFEGTAYGNSAWSSSNIFLVKYDSLGNGQWADIIGGSNIDQPKSLCTDNLNNVYLTGFFQSESVTFGNNNLLNDSTATRDAFIAKIAGEKGELGTAQIKGENYTVFPNPFNKSLNIVMNEYMSDASLAFSDVTGNILREMNHISGNQTKIMLDDIPAGVYFITLFENGIPVLREKVIAVGND